MRTITIIATGESVTFDTIDYIRHSVTDVMVVNESFLLAPWADYLYAADASWWECYADCVESTFHGERFAPRVEGKTFTGIEYKKLYEGVSNGDGSGGLSKDAGVVNHGNHSGHAACNVAYHLGYERIILVGFDFVGNHWFHPQFRSAGTNKHPVKDSATHQVGLHTMEDIIKDLQDEGVEVVNCSKGSKLSLEYKPLESVL